MEKGMPRETATAQAAKKRRPVDYSDSRWQIMEIYSKFRPPVRVLALSHDQAKLKARRALGVAWLEVTAVFVVNMYRVTCELDGATLETEASGINETDARFYLAKRLIPKLPRFISVEYISTLWEYNRSKGKGPNDLYAPEEQPEKTTETTTVASL